MHFLIAIVASFYELVTGRTLRILIVGGCGIDCFYGLSFTPRHLLFINVCPYTFCCLVENLFHKKYVLFYFH